MENWNNFVLNEKFNKLDKQVDEMKEIVNDIYDDFTNIDMRNTLVRVVETLEDMVESISIFKMLYGY